jgi:ABC-2 type transport system ATP-binding protein
MMELIRKLGREGKTVLISSHVLDEVERVADRILVIVNGKLAAAGDFRAIRDRIDEHARGVRIRAADARGLAGALIQEHTTVAIRLEPGSNSGQPTIIAETADVRAFYTAVPAVAQRANIRLYKVSAVDDSLASVFAYVVGR